MNLRNQNGFSLVESIAALPILITMVVGLSVSLLWGWTRLEISVLAQELMVCERSKLGSSNCRRQFESKLRDLPGNWQVLQYQAQPQKLTLRLQSSFKGLRHVFKFSEPDPWLDVSQKPFEGKLLPH